ncbi:hypothetical protein [Curtobacterium caseinilyticum]|uniref:Oligosaccharide repeat unit polymerase n=1 Tax=Curtobacterium caseinilyticum TaxID=3055137 RepID=A0ABT7TQT2_9MICO|nr:hypothetical protein [Curtobacterium caseinilyticum]MDM7891957.1 hypothetical protein [Curtobacterium caseinilyticum]
MITNYHFWYAVTWLCCLLVYSWGWSELNAPLRADLIAFLLITAMTSIVILVLQAARGTAATDRWSPAREEPASGGRKMTAFFILGFAADFAYQGGVPFFRGEYSGFDITAQLQSTVGIPIIHVILIAGVIFYALERVDRLIVTRSKTYAVQFALLMLLLLLNNSRGYMTFVLIGSLLLLVARRFSSGGKIRPGVLISVAIAGIAVLYGVGVFGNIRSGSPWWDSSYISHLGRYQDRYPDWLSEQFQWAYTYFTSPLGNLNLNLSAPVSGHWYQVLLMFVPDTVGKYLLLGKVNVLYQVSYLNAPTGYVVPYFLGGGLSGLYFAYAAQVALLETGGVIARRLGGAVVLYRVCACVVVIVFVFFNSFADVATCFLLPLALILGAVRRRSIRKQECSPGRAQLHSFNVGSSRDAGSRDVRR